MLKSLMEISRAGEELHTSASSFILFWEDSRFLKRFKIAPASKWIHHNYLGGLLGTYPFPGPAGTQECRHYKGLNLDLLLAGSILHDLGKIDELSYRRSLDYSDEGRLLGHIILGIERMEDKIRQIPDFPKDLATTRKTPYSQPPRSRHLGLSKKADDS